MKTEELLAEISDLPIEERAKIVDGILKTLNKPNPELDARWMEEVERRAKEVESGEVEMITAKEFEKKRKEKRNF
ncbi:MAG: addiction module protein [Balneolaceae bacterium]|nr:addiction module protein [Balneolaceae bacterium]